MLIVRRHPLRSSEVVNVVGTLATPRATIREPATPPHPLPGMLDRMYTAVAANALTFWIVQDEQKLRMQASLTNSGLLFL